MTKAGIEVVRGSGNVFRDFGDANAEILQMKAILAAEVIKRLDAEGLTVRQAQSKTGIAAADFSRIRGADLARFSLERLMTVIIRLGGGVEVTVTGGQRRQRSKGSARGPQQSPQ
ncbi:MAG TPA: helix-turn-helix transcriptional regulator [Steroidobacteraceae bacterium]|jgi:predicted XRE-type DNA-binding protein